MTLGSIEPESPNPNQKRKRNFRDLSSLPTAESVELTPDLQELYFDLIRKNFIPKIVEISKEVGQKGEEFPLFGEKKWYRVDVTVETPQSGGRSNYLSVGIDRFIHPEPLEIDKEQIGNMTCQLTVFDGQRNIWFIVLDDETFAFKNDNDRGEPTVIRTKEDLFRVTDSHPLFPVGNPAGWVNKILQREIIPQFEDKLANLPAKR